MLPHPRLLAAGRLAHDLSLVEPSRSRGSLHAWPTSGLFAHAAVASRRNTVSRSSA